MRHQRVTLIITLGLAVLPCLAASGPAHLQYLQLEAPFNPPPAVIATDAAGNICVVSTHIKGPLRTVGGLAAPDADILVTRLDSSGGTLSTFTFGGSDYEEPHGAVFDSQGNLYIVGATFSADFPVLNGAITQTAPDLEAGFAVKLDPSGTRLLYATLLGGLQPGFGATTFPGTVANAVAVDSQGNAYVTGHTSSGDYPVTPGAFQTSGAANNHLNNSYSAFVTKISADGKAILYSTFLGGTEAFCEVFEEDCLTITPIDEGFAIAVDENGVATVAGTTNSIDFPVTPGAFQGQCNCNQNAGNGFVTRLNADASALVWSTFLGGSPFFALIATPLFPESGGVIRSIALAADGSVVVAGMTASSDFPVTPAAPQTAFGGSRSPDAGTPYNNGFLSKLNSAGTSLLFSTYLGTTGKDSASGVALDAAGRIWVAIASGPPTFLYTNVPPNGFLARFNSDGSDFEEITGLAMGASELGLALLSDGLPVVLGSSGSLLIVPAEGLTGISMVAVANVAASTVSGYVAPYEILSIYGTGLGPDPPLGAQLDSGGRITTQLGGTQVLFDGIPAPLLYAGANQINLVVPSEIYVEKSTAMQIVTAQGTSQTLNLGVVDAQPAIFHNSDFTVIALNQDGTLNSPANPAKRGSIITIYASGAGQVDASPHDGSISGPDLALSSLPVGVSFEELKGDVLYAGSAPDLVAGLLQVNVRVPDSSVHRVFWLQAGDWTSDAVMLAVE